jgi:hypothetical protein
MSGSLTFLGNSFGALYEGSPEADGAKFKASAALINDGAKQYNVGVFFFQMWFEFFLKNTIVVFRSKNKKR